MHLKGGVASNFHGLVDSVHAFADALCAIALTPALSSFSGRIKRRLEVNSTCESNTNGVGRTGRGGVRTRYVFLTVLTSPNHICGSAQPAAFNRTIP